MAVQFTKLSVSPEVVQTTGTSETAVMSQKAVTDALTSAGGSSGGGSPITINITARLFSGSMSNNQDSNGILNKTDFPYYKSTSQTLTDEQYSTITNALNQHKRLLFKAQGMTFDGIVMYASHVIDAIGFNDAVVSYRIKISSDKRLTFYIYMTSSNLNIDQSLESIILV